MKNKGTEEQLRELEEQLSCPNGKMGIEVGKDMHATNFGMTLNAIEYLDIQNGDSVLELGHGNCGHLDELLDSANEINYHGLEISETMLHEAIKGKGAQPAQFDLYDGETIPYPNQFFHRTFSVNTVYFWSNPKRLISEIERTLKPNGLCVLSFGTKDFMENLPFVGQKFTLFDRNDMKKLAASSSLKIVEMKELTEEVKSKTGEEVQREYAMIKLKRR